MVYLTFLGASGPVAYAMRLLRLMSSRIRGLGLWIQSTLPLGPSSATRFNDPRKPSAASTTSGRTDPLSRTRTCRWLIGPLAFSRTSWTRPSAASAEYGSRLALRLATLGHSDVRQIRLPAFLAAPAHRPAWPPAHGRSRL